MSKYLDNDGLLYFWQKIKTLLAGKVDAVSGKGLSTNDFTDALKTKLENSSAYELPTASASTKGGVKIGTGLTMAGEVLSADVQSTNDYTTAEKTKLAGIAEGANNYTYTLPTASASAKGGVKIGSGLTMTGEVLSANTQSTNDYTTDEKTKLAALPTNATLESTYAKKTDITSMYKHKGSVATVADLPASATAGDVYNVTATGMNYVWVDATTKWDALGEVFSISSITNSEIDTILAS